MDPVKLDSLEMDLSAQVRTRTVCTETLCTELKESILCTDLDECAENDMLCDQKDT